ncbi:hypothetical protein [Candidatus Hodarchaeum mangrovi]
MIQSTKDDSLVNQEEIIKLSTRIGFSILLVYGIILLLESIFFLATGSLITQLTGSPLIPINIVTIAFLLLGAVGFTYYYHTRYVKREIILLPDKFSISIGKRIHEYKWTDFSIVALAVSFSHYGAKGFIIRLFEEDLESEYVDLAIYRFPKSINVFDLRNKIEEKVKEGNLSKNLGKNKN